MNPMIQKVKQITRLIVTTPRFGWILSTQIISGLASFIGLPVLIPVLETMQDKPISAGAQGFLGYVAGPMRALGLEPSFHSMLFVAAVLILTGQALISASSLLAAYAKEEILREYRQKIFNGYARADWLWLTDSRSGGVLYAIVKEAQFASEAHLNAQRVFINFFQLATFFLIALRLSAPVTLLAVLIYTVIGVVSIINSNFVHRLADLYNRNLTRLSNVVSGFQQNKKFFKTSLLGGQLQGKIMALVDDISANYKRQNVHMEIQRLWSMLSTSIFLIVLILFHDNLNLDSATLLLMLLIFFRLAPQFTALSTIYAVLDSTIPMHTSLQKHLRELQSHTEPNGTEPFDPDRDIRLVDVSYRYPRGDEIIRHCSLDIPARQTTAIVGSSGVGKSTLLDLILGLMAPQSGTIFYGDVPHDRIDKSSLRRQLAYVTQQPNLIDGTLRENLTIGCPQADEQRILEVCRKVRLDNFIRQLPQGLETMVGEGGIKLSGGQRQRVVLGRSLLMVPRLLILDEATSELDVESERLIQETIAELRKELTIILVAHRLSTVRLADRIYVLDSGTVCESGTYEELMAQKGRFYSLEILQQG